MVSVVIPTFNRRGFLAEAVRSVIRQTLTEWELIVVDDGSRDGSDEVVAGFNESRIRLLRQDNAGVSAARNAGIQASRFDWIAFLDSDDSWKPSKLEAQVRALENEPHYRVCHTNEIWIRNGIRVNPKKIHRKHGGWIYHRCLPLCLVSPSSIMVHRQVLERIGTFDEGFPVCEDYELWLRMTGRYPLLFLEAPLVVKTGGHADQLSRSRWGLDRYRVRALIKTYRNAPLTHQLRHWTAREIARKASILARGFENRGKPREAGRFTRLAREWEVRGGQGGATSSLSAK